MAAPIPSVTKHQHLCFTQQLTKKRITIKTLYRWAGYQACYLNAQLHIIKKKPSLIKKRCHITGNFFPNRSRSHWFLWGHMTYNNKIVSRQSPTEILGAITLRNLWRQRVTVQCYPRTLSTPWDVENFIKGYNKWSLGETVNFISLKSQCLLRKQSLSVYWRISQYTSTGKLTFDYADFDHQVFIQEESNCFMKPCTDKFVDCKS